MREDSREHDPPSQKRGARQRERTLWQDKAFSVHYFGGQWQRGSCPGLSLAHPPNPGFRSIATAKVAARSMELCHGRLKAFEILFLIPFW